MTEDMAQNQSTGVAHEDKGRPITTWGPFKCYVTPWEVGGVSFPGKKRYEGVRFNVICITRGWVGSNSLENSAYVTLEWPHGGGL